MKCPNCNKTISELDEKCPACGLVFEEYESQNNDDGTEVQEGNKTILLKVINIILLISCIIMAIVFWNDEETLTGFIFLFSGIVLFAFIKGFTNIIDLLDSINNKIDK